MYRYKELCTDKLKKASRTAANTVFLSLAAAAASEFAPTAKEIGRSMKEPFG